MAGTIISGSHLTGIVLSNAATENPATIAAGGYVTNTTTAYGGDAVFGLAGTAWRVTNLGTIKATETNSTGVFLSAGGSVTNGSSSATKALIESAADGVVVNGTAGRVTNFGTIAVIGSFAATVVVGADGTVTNSGTISADAIGGVASGVDLTTGGSITNSGVITAAGTRTAGIVLSGPAAVTNSGTVSSSSGAGIFGYTGDKVFNSGLITGATGVNLGAGLVLTNFGTVLGSTGYGVLLQSGGTITNGSTADRTAVISSAGRAISIGGTAGGAGTVTNFGTIENTSTATVPLGPAIYIGGGGTITNYGLVEGAQPSTGGTQGVITTHHDYATIRNFGTILSTNGNDTIHIDHGGTVINGATDATGALISGLSSGIVGGNNPSTGVAYGAGAGVTLLNYGTIQNTGTGAVISFTSGGKIANYGTIEGTGTGNPGGTGIVLAGSAARVTNFGTIISAGENGFGVDLHTNGYVRNIGLISAYHIGVYANTTTSTGTVVNLGTIKSTQKATPITFDGDGILLEKGGYVRNGSTIDLTAMISAVDGKAVSMHGNGTLANFGTIEVSSTGTSGAGVLLEAGGIVTNGAGGSTAALIHSTRRGVNAENLAATVVNYGAIHSLATTGTASQGVELGAGGVVRNGIAADRNAVISAVYGNAVAIGGTAGGSGTVTNFGTVTNSSTVNPALYLGAGGVVTNGASGSTAALIKGGADGISVVGGAARITNFGTITGTTGIAVTAADTAAVTLTNSGTIVGSGGTAVQFGAGNDVLTVDAGAVFKGAVAGGGGSNKLVQGAPGTLTVTGFSGFETIVLADGGLDTLTLKGANFAGVTKATITIDDGNMGNTVSAIGEAAGDRIVVHAGPGLDLLTGGGGSDVFYAGGDTTMTGGLGTNEFVFTAPGGNTIEDFAKSSTNRLVFSNSGFDLGLSGGTATPKRFTAAEAAALFTENPTGTFADTSQRLAYDTTSHELFSSSDGSGSTPLLVATLSDHAAISASQLFYISGAGGSG